MKIGMEINLGGDVERQLFELVAEWSSPDRMTENSMVFAVQIQTSLLRGLAEHHAELVERKKKAILDMQAWELIQRQREKHDESQHD